MVVMKFSAQAVANDPKAQASADRPLYFADVHRIFDERATLRHL